MNRNLFIVVICGLASAGWADAPIGTMYFTQQGLYPNSSATKVGKLSGPSIFGIISNVQSVATANDNQGPLAVAQGDIRTYTNNMWGSSSGGRYDLNLNYLGTSYSPWQMLPGNSLYDGTTDGSSNFTVEYNGMIIQTDRSWQSPSVLNGSGFGGLGYADFKGITWDPSTNSFWLSCVHPAAGSSILNVSPTGLLLSNFSVSSIYWGLAMDVDGTLWGSRGTSIEHFTTSGGWIGSAVVATWGGNDPAFGIEIDVGAVPEPTTVATLGFGAAVLARRRRRNS